MIPKIFHQIWFQGSDKIFKSYKKYQKTCIKNHSHWKYMFWDQPKIENLIKESYPQYWDLYCSYPYMIQKIDLAKVIIIYHYGGIYLDMDVQCIKSFDNLFSQSSFPDDRRDLVFSTFFANCAFDDKFCSSALGVSGLAFYDQPILSNGFFAAAPKHPFWIDLLAKFRENKDNCFRWINTPFYISRSTGIAVLTDLVRNKWKDNVTILHYKYLEPCGSKFQECKVDNDTYAIDHLGNSWISSPNQSIIYYFSKYPKLEIWVLLFIGLILLIGIYLIIKKFYRS